MVPSGHFCTQTFFQYSSPGFHMIVLCPLPFFGVAAQSHVTGAHFHLSVRLCCGVRQLLWTASVLWRSLCAVSGHGLHVGAGGLLGLRRLSHAHSLLQLGGPSARAALVSAAAFSFYPGSELGLWQHAALCRLGEWSLPGHSFQGPRQWKGFVSALLLEWSRVVPVPARTGPFSPSGIRELPASGPLPPPSSRWFLDRLPPPLLSCFAAVLSESVLPRGTLQ